MNDGYVFIGNDAVGNFVESKLDACGFTRVEDAGSASVAITYCTNSPAIEDAYFDDGGLVKCMPPKSLLIDLSACAPSLAREISAVCAVNDLRFVEAPLVFDAPCDAGALLDSSALGCFVAGEEADVEEAAEILEILAVDVEIVGSRSGSAQLVKAARTIQDCAQLLSAVEAEALFAAARESSNSVDCYEGDVPLSTDLAAQVVQAIENRSFHGAYTVEMLMGEVAAAMTAADDVELILPQVEALTHLLEILAVVGGVDMNPAALSLLYRSEEAGNAAGLDWSRAESFFLHDEHEHEHEDDGYSDSGYDDLDMGGYPGTLGSYSSN